MMITKDRPYGTSGCGNDVDMPIMMIDVKTMVLTAGDAYTEDYSDDDDDDDDPRRIRNLNIDRIILRFYRSFDLFCPRVLFRPFAMIYDPIRDLRNFVHLTSPFSFCLFSMIKITTPSKQLGI